MMAVLPVLVLVWVAAVGVLVSVVMTLWSLCGFFVVLHVPMLVTVLVTMAVIVAMVPVAACPRGRSRHRRCC